MVVDEAIRLEMAYTPYNGACRDAHITPEARFRMCRRAALHKGRHASEGPYEEWD